MLETRLPAAEYYLGRYAADGYARPLIAIDPFKACHMEALLDREPTQWLSRYITAEKMQAIEARGGAYAAICRGKVLACAGLWEHWPSRAEAWAVIASDVGEHMITIHRAVKKFLDRSEFKRVEAVVEKGFHAGHRWISMLDFAVETHTMPNYYPDGRSATMYVRIR